MALMHKHNIKITDPILFSCIWKCPCHSDRMYPLSENMMMTQVCSFIWSFSEMTKMDIFFQWKVLQYQQRRVLSIFQRNFAYTRNGLAEIPLVTKIRDVYMQLGKNINGKIPNAIPTNTPSVSRGVGIFIVKCLHYIVLTMTFYGAPTLKQWSRGASNISVYAFTLPLSSSASRM